jgi:hypothetical protein
MRRITSITAAFAAAALFALVPAAFARHTAGDGRGHDDRVPAAQVQQQKAKDDPANHDAKDDKGQNARGADDAPGHDAGDDKGGSRKGHK